MELFVGAGIGLSVYGTLQGGKAAAEEGKIIQAGKYAEAKEQERAGEYESRQKRREKARTIGAMIAQTGAKGTTLTGTNLTSIANTAAEIEADAWMLWRNRKVAAAQLKYEGDIARYQGRVARRASRIRAAMNIINPIAQLMGTSFASEPAKGSTSSYQSKSNSSYLPRVGTVSPQAGATYSRY